MAMSLSGVVVQVVLIFVTFLSFSKPNIVIAQTPNYLSEACNNYNVKQVINPDLCLKILQSQKKIVSSTNQIDLSIAIIEFGISNGTNTRTYMENMLEKKNLDPNLKGVLQECKLSYDSAIGSMQSALGEVKGRDYETSTYDLMIASKDNIHRCEKVVASKKINDATILFGNKVISVFGLISFNVIMDLYTYLSPPPAMN